MINSSWLTIDDTSPYSFPSGDTSILAVEISGYGSNVSFHPWFISPEFNDGILLAIGGRGTKLRRLKVQEN